MELRRALSWFARGEALAWRALRAGALPRAGMRAAVGAFARPLTAPSRYAEFEAFEAQLADAIDLNDPAHWILDIGSPKPFSLLLAARSRVTVVATDIWAPAIAEAEALSRGLSAEALARVRLATMDVRQPVPAALQPPSGRFAAAFSMSVIEHIEPDPGGDVAALESLAAAVRPGGGIVISVPVDRSARSEHRRSEIYGRVPTDDRGVFFQRVYDRAALKALCERMSSALSLECCVHCKWPELIVNRIQARFPTAIGFAGALFPLFAPRFDISAPTRDIPQIDGPGDVILRFKRCA